MEGPPRARQAVFSLRMRHTSNEGTGSRRGAVGAAAGPVFDRSILRFSDPARKTSTHVLSRHLLVLLLGSLALSAQAAETFHFKVAELLLSETARKYMDPAVKLYWGDEAPPALQEIARPDTQTGIGISGSLFSGGTRAHCVEAFENALRILVNSARSGGYDTVLNIRVYGDRKTTPDAATFSCTPGYKSTEVRFMSTYAMTPAAAQRFAEQQKQSFDVPAREPSNGAIFVPLAPVLASPELKTILGRHVRAYWGRETTAYDERGSHPQDYSEDVELGSAGPEDACRKATLKALDAMVKEARSEDYDSLLMVRSYLNDRYAPSLTDIECELGKKSASVTLRTWMANRK